MSFREFKDTCDYILDSISDQNVPLAALGLYSYLIILPKSKRKIARNKIMDRCNISKNTLHKYVRALRDIGILETEQVLGEATEYIPRKLGNGPVSQKVRHDVSQNLGRPKNKDRHTTRESLSAPVKRPSGRTNSQSPFPSVSGHKNCDTIITSDQKAATKLIPRINKVLPKDERFRGVVPNDCVKKLLRLEKDGILDEYTKWFVDEKLLNKGTNVYSFGWKIFLFPSMLKEFKKNHRTAEDMGLKTTSRWAGREEEALKAADEKVKKIERIKAEKAKEKKRGKK